MSSPKNWKDVAKEVLEGLEFPQVQAEKPNRQLKSGLGWFYDWQLNHPEHQDKIAVITIALTFGIPAILIFVLYNMWVMNVMQNTPCENMLNWAIRRVPARCLAELSEVIPK